MDFNGVLLASPVFVLALLVLLSRPGRRMLKAWGRGLGVVDRNVHEELNDHFLEAELVTLRDQQFQEEVKLVRAQAALAKLNQEISLLEALQTSRAREALKEATKEANKEPVTAEIKQPSPGEPSSPRRDQAHHASSRVTPIARPA